jgi:hypothetical protein
VPEGSVVRYRAFPFFADENYRILTRASIRVLLRQSGIAWPNVELVRWSDDSLDVLGHHE